MDVVPEDIAAGDAADLSVPESNDGIPLEHCTPGEYKEAKNGRCYLCNDAGYGFVDEGTEIDDNDLCTDDFCDPVKGVLHPVNSAPCDDGDPETVDDVCFEGDCVGTPLLCEAGMFAAQDGNCALCNADGTEFVEEGAQIDDGDVCTDDFCDPESGVGHEFNEAPCDDGDPDTADDLCADGVCAGVGTFCTPEEFKYVQGMCNLCNDNGTDWLEDGEVINDGNPCTDDACDSKQGVLHLNNDGPCDDGDPATGDDSCVDGECVGTPITCEAGKYAEDNGLCQLCADDGSGWQGDGEPVDDGDVCTDDLCDADAGVLHPLNSEPCDDGNPDTGSDICSEGVCSGVPIICDPGQFVEDNGKCYLCDELGSGYDGDGEMIDDGNVCTDDLCDPFDGVGKVFNDGPCDDDNSGTIYDACADGVCSGIPVVCPAAEYVSKDGLCFLCNDDGTSFAGAGETIDDGNVCTDETCDPAAGLVSEFNVAPCDDGNEATGNDTCADGECIGVPIVCESGKYVDDNGICSQCAADGAGYVGDGEPVDDGNECTDDVCDPDSGVGHAFNSDACDDGDPATINDSCDAGVCSGVLLVCPAGEHVDVEGLCALCNAEGTAFADDGAPIDDGNVCTDDQCDAGAGVEHANNNIPCDDGDPATTDDLCADGVCAGTPIVCAPGEYVDEGGTCQLCNAAGTGYEGAGEPVDDGDICTDDACDPGQGVSHAFNSAPCDDGNPATVNDTCVDGECLGDAVLCPPGDHVDDGGMCRLCNGDGTAYLDAGVALDDGNLCTDDACDPGAGVEHSFNDAPCDDGDPDTINDVCQQGSCVGQPLVCTPDEWVSLADGWWCRQCNGDGTDFVDDGVSVDDEDVCTDDACDAAAGVIHTNNNAPCDDGEAATMNDTCVDGECLGEPVVCPAGDYVDDGGMCKLCNADGTAFVDGGAPVDDGNPCTDDNCDPGLGVEHGFNSDVCDDGDPDTVDDECVDGVCVGIPVACPAGDYVDEGGACRLCNGAGTGYIDAGDPIDDGNLCTDDVCDPGTGVEHYPNDVLCDDNDAGTVNDQCEQGVCVGEPVICPAGEWVTQADGWWCELCNDDGTGWSGGEDVSDDDVCTDDVCDPVDGVGHTFNSAPCDDGDPDTNNDTCVDGLCIGDPPFCPAGDYVEDAGLCYLCNGDGSGWAGPGEAIDDGDICTDDACDPGNGVENEFNTAPCDDGDPDTMNDACADGVCAGSPVACPAGDYAEDEGLCKLCNGDGDGWVGDGDVIDDGDLCTDDTCDAGNGVEHNFNNEPCNDGNPLTALDQCVLGVCIGVPVMCPPGEWVTLADGWWCELCNEDGTDYAGGVDVDDENQCTEDVCDPLLGVTHTPIEGPCWDFNPCTDDDVCMDAVCAGTPVDCDDLSVCTADSCDPDLGMCVHSPVSVPCDDGIDATVDDQCVEGICVGMLDPDGDGVPNYGSGPLCDPPAIKDNCVDNCAYVANPDQKDSNHDGFGDKCSIEPRWWMRINTSEKVVALTFDDGWDNDAFELLLAALNEDPAYATFFINGMYVDDGTIEVESLVKARNAGHKLGNHTYNHDPGANVAESVVEIMLNEQAYSALGFGILRPVYRIPSPDIVNPPWWVHLALQQTGYTESVIANFDTMDWVDDPVEISAQGMVDCVTDQVEPGDIISMHVGPDHTAQALPQIIANLKAQGYTLLTIEQIIAYGDPVYFLDLTQVKTCGAYF